MLVETPCVRVEFGCKIVINIKCHLQVVNDTAFSQQHSNYFIMVIALCVAVAGVPTCD